MLFFFLLPLYFLAQAGLLHPFTITLNHTSMFIPQSLSSKYLSAPQLIYRPSAQPITINQDTEYIQITIMTSIHTDTLINTVK